MRPRAVFLFFLFALAPGVMLATAWPLFGLGAGEDDVLYYLPMRTQFHNAFRDGDVPTFNRWNGLGRPLLIDPQTATYYPATWLFGLSKVPVLYAYAAHLWLHYSLALWGAYRMLRAQPHKPAAAVLGAIAFAFCGFMLAHRNHFTMVAAAAWTPIVFWRIGRLLADRRSRVGNSARAGYLRFLLATIAIALQLFAGHPQVAVLTLLGCLVWVGARLWRPLDASVAEMPEGDAAPPEPAMRVVPTLRTATVLALPWCAAIALFAIQWVPTVQYTALCDRADWSYWEFTENSYEPLSLVAWVYPMLLGNATPNLFSQPYWGPSHQSEQLGYIGIAPLVLAALALRAPWRRSPVRRPWAILLLFSFLLALGRFGPICPLLYWLPGSQIFRCPSRALLLIDLCLAALACSVVDDLLRGLTPKRSRLRAALRDATANPVKTAVYLLLPPIAIVLAALPWVDSDAFHEALRALWPTNLGLLMPIPVTIVTLLGLGVFARAWREPRSVYLLIFITACDLYIVSSTVYAPSKLRPIQQNITPDAENQWLPYVRDDRRIWTATAKSRHKPGEYIDSLNKCVANTNLLEPDAEPHAILTDYGPLQPREYVAAFAMRPWGESTQTVALLHDTSWTTSANVGWILVADPDLPPPANSTHVTTTDAGYRLYDVGNGGAFARFVDATVPGALRAEWLSNNSFALHAAVSPQGARTDSEVEVEISLLDLPGWKYTLDGVTRPIPHAENSLYLRIPVPANLSEPVIFSFSTPGLETGAAISMAAVVLVLTPTLLLKRGQRLTRPAAASRR